ncbi:MAG: hypothetical protein NT159_20420 [Proteobacteria bacterium]|nr:hypothetical protein [Pseudomonadota bacterium]
MNRVKILIALLVITMNSMAAVASVTTVEVFAYAASKYPSLFAGTPTGGQYLQYTYQYYPTSQSFLAVDGAGIVYVLGPYTNNALTPVGPVSAFSSLVTAWETTPTLPSAALASEIAVLGKTPLVFPDTYFLTQFSGILAAIDGVPNGAQQFGVYLNNVVLGPTFSSSAAINPRALKVANGVNAKAQSSSPPCQNSPNNVINEILNSSTYDGPVAAFFKSIFGSLTGESIPDPSSTGLAAADPAVAVGLIMAKYRTDFNNLCANIGYNATETVQNYCYNAGQQWNAGNYAGALQTLISGAGLPQPSFLLPPGSPGSPAACSTAPATATLTTLTTATSGAGSGTVVSSVSPTGTDIFCGGTVSAPVCSTAFAAGSSVTLLATPASGSTFAGWTGACTGLAKQCIVTMSTNQTVTATFTLVVTVGVFFNVPGCAGTTPYSDAYCSMTGCQAQATTYSPGWCAPMTCTSAPAYTVHTSAAHCLGPL